MLPPFVVLGRIHTKNKSIRKETRIYKSAITMEHHLGRGIKYPPIFLL